VLLVGVASHGAEARLEGDRERSGGARRQRDLRERLRALEVVGPLQLLAGRHLADRAAAELEARAVVDVRNNGAEVVCVGLDLAPKRGAGDRKLDWVARRLASAVAGDRAQCGP
jgi:hypothetical protein